MKKINKGICASIALLMIIGVSFYAFFTYVDTTASAAIESRLIETAKNNSLIVNTIIERDEKQLRGSAERLVNATDIHNVMQTQALLKDIIQYDSFSHLIIFTQDNLVYNEEEMMTNTIDVSINEVLKDKVQAIETPENGKGFAINVPIQKDGVCYGVLSGVYYSDQIRELLDYRVFDGQGYFGVLNQEGNVLIGTEKFQELYKVKSIFDTLQNETFAASYSLEDIKQGLSNQKSFLTSYTLGNIRQYTYLMPLKISDWYILSAVPAAYLSTYKAGIDTAVCILIIFMSILFIALIIIILLQNRRSQRLLKSDRDMMIRIMNTVPIPIIMSDQNSNIVQLNRSAKEVFEKQDTFIGKPCSCIQTDACKTSQCPMRKFKEEGVASTTLTCDNVKYFVTTSQMNDANKVCIGYIETFQDVSEIMKSKHVLEERTLELETISENLSVGLLITSLEEGFPILQCNQTYLDLIDEKQENVIGKPATHWLLKKEASNVADDIVKQLHTKGKVYLEHLLKRNEKDELWVSLSGKQGQLHNQNVGIWILVDITERKRSDKNIRINEERYRLAAENSEDIIVDYDISRDVMLHNEKVIELYGVDVLVEKPLQNILAAGIIAPDYIEIFQRLFDKIHSGESKIVEDLKTITKAGEEVWLHVIFTTIFDDQHKAIRAIGVMHDFTLEKKALIQYEHELQYRKVTMEDVALSYEVDITDAIFLTGHESLVKKYTEEETNEFDVVIQLMLDHLVYEEDRMIVYQHTRLEYFKERYALHDNKIEFEYRRVLVGKEPGWVLCTIHLYEDKASKHLRLIGYIKDIDSAKKTELHLKQQAQQDLLTGLYNKITTQHKVEVLLEQGTMKLGALAIIDLDDFKNINDGYGHAFGDAVLSEVSQRLITLCQEEEIVGRIGGDEFIVFFHDMYSIEEIRNKAESICTMFHNAYTGNYNNYKISGSIGVALYPKDGTSFDELYHHADIALYASKNRGKNRYYIYDNKLPAIGSQQTMRKIDSNAGKQLSGNMPEYVLRILYEAKDATLVLNAILELVARQLKLSRGYVFVRAKEKNYWRNTNEWCAEGIPTQKDNLQHAKFGEDDYELQFNEQHEFICNDSSKLTGFFVPIIKDLHVKSFLQIAIKRDGQMIGFVGFDNCWETWQPTKKEIENIHIIVMLMDTFVFRNNDQQFL